MACSSPSLVLKYGVNGTGRDAGGGGDVLDGRVRVTALAEPGRRCGDNISGADGFLFFAQGHQVSVPSWGALPRPGRRRGILKSTIRMHISIVEIKRRRTGSAVQTHDFLAVQ
jgi:hypothetical protein